MQGRCRGVGLSRGIGASLDNTLWRGDWEEKQEQGMRVTEGGEEERKRSSHVRTLLKFQRRLENPDMKMDSRIDVC